MQFVSAPCARVASLSDSGGRRGAVMGSRRGRHFVGWGGVSDVALGSSINDVILEGEEGMGL